MELQEDWAISPETGSSEVCHRQWDSVRDNEA